MTPLTARQEWAAMWPIPLVCMVGVSGSAMFAYAGGVYMESVTAEFGWSRAEYSSAFLLMMLSGLFLAPAAGWLTDRVGPRKVALGGMVPFALSISLFGLVHGALWQWYAVCLLLAVFQAAITQIVWMKAIVSRFDHSRGLAMAVTLAGLGLGSFIWPVLAAIFVETIGWRGAFPAMAALYLLVALPSVYLFFHVPAHQDIRQSERGPRKAIASALRSRTFVGLAAAAGLFSAINYGMSMHLVPLFKADGLDLTAAAGIAGLVGVFSIVGRLVTGILLDRLPTRIVGVFAFLLPLGAIACLLGFPGAIPAAVVAVALLGFASGAELDIVTYIVARRFEQEMFGSIYAAFIAIISICASIGPVIAGAIYDASHSYIAWLITVVPMVIVAAGIVALIPFAADEGKLV
ncbi:MFS transporter [Novosphingobium sp. G106]|uniref:MFS transporter n=1 Tax=Novosphingobium sp. G106 TaxID=2849500 RepID=UPI001C2D2909|nr:MFS transporter [Novosphingobium sp. G106]MBV1690397.1 MFS transporter [Novosphingobium sp. G106]